MKLIDLLAARKTLSDLSNRDDILAKLSYWMTKFVIQTDGEAESYDASLNKILSKYGESGEQGTTIRKENIAEAQAEIDSLNSTEVEAPTIRFKLSDLSDINLTMKQIYSLFPFIDEDQ